MKQLTQKLKDGVMKVQDVPEPQLGSKMILVQNHYSLISAGTEGSTAKTARKGLIGKAKERPQQVKQVIDTLRKQGPLQTYRAVTKKLEAYSPCGYSSAGIVIEVGEGVTEFKAGDKVACAGAGYANHAEFVTVPVNLAVKLDDDADLKNASYNTLGAIAMQGVRQADLRLGECCTVIGLGLLGQLTCLFLKASGVRVVGVDVSEAAVQMAKSHCADLAVTRSAPGVNESINEFSGGNGVDAVIITAATSSLDPINFAGAIARKKGRVIVVGAVPTGFDREPDYYKKELELKMSCSYGPGRYDLDYEEKGVDYPVAYVRWTEKRNMQAFQQLLADKRIDIGYLTTHNFKFTDAPQAYDMIVNRTEPFLGIALEYDIEQDFNKHKITIGGSTQNGKVNIGFIGAGSYAQGSLLPNIHCDDSVVCKGVLTNSGTTSKRVAERFKFEFCTAAETDIIDNSDINTIFVATRHDSHADYVIKALNAGKNVFVEKPLAMNLEQLEVIETCLNKQTAPPLLMIGFNRRFAPFAIKLKKQLGEGAMSMLYRINAGNIPADSWIQDAEMGGGRIIGEGCHFIDFMSFICGSVPVRVYASALPDAAGLNDTVNINIEFANGSTGVVAYYANGSKAMDKEYFEAYRAGTTGIIRDFKILEIFGKKRHKEKMLNQNKGQAGMVKAFIDAIKNGEDSPISFAELNAVTRVTISAVESIQTKQSIEI
jgi:polar amino acid transport system substrate-binding protein